MNTVWILMLGMILAFIGFVFLGKAWGETEDNGIGIDSEWFNTYRGGVWSMSLGLGLIIIALLMDNYDLRRTKQLSIIR